MPAHLGFVNYLVGVGRALEANPNWREGQAYFNTLVEHNPPLAESVRGTLVDPFHSDVIVPEFLEHIEREWTAC